MFQLPFVADQIISKRPIEFATDIFNNPTRQFLGSGELAAKLKCVFGFT